MTKSDICKSYIGSLLLTKADLTTCHWNELRKTWSLASSILRVDIPKNTVVLFLGESMVMNGFTGMNVLHLDRVVTVLLHRSQSQREFEILFVDSFTRVDNAK